MPREKQSYQRFNFEFEILQNIDPYILHHFISKKIFLIAIQTVVFKSVADFIYTTSQNKQAFIIKTMRSKNWSNAPKSLNSIKVKERQKFQQVTVREKRLIFPKSG